MDKTGCSYRKRKILGLRKILLAITNFGQYKTHLRIRVSMTWKDVQRCPTTWMKEDSHVHLGWPHRPCWQPGRLLSRGRPNVACGLQPGQDGRTEREEA